MISASLMLTLIGAMLFRRRLRFLVLMVDPPSGYVHGFIKKPLMAAT